MNDQRKLPLDGLRVIDFGMFWAGPYTGMYLGAQGADVVKVESVKRPDTFRFNNVLPTDELYYETSSLFQWTNMNKRGLTLDLVQEEGRRLGRELISGADVVIENFSPRVMEQFGLDYETLAADNPGLIMVRMPAFGLSGPWRDFLGWASVFEQIAGMAMTTGYPDDNPVTPGGYLDPIVGMHATVAVLAALEERERSGLGQLIEVAQIEATLALTADQVIRYSITGEETSRAGNRSERFAPQGVWRAADGRWLALSVTGDEQWRAFADVLGDPGLARDAALGTVDGRQEHADRIEERVAAWVAERGAEDTASRLRSAGIPAIAVISPEYPHRDPQLAARGQYEQWEHPVVGERLYMGWPMRFSGRTSHHANVAPTLGQHNHEILGALGLGDKEIDALAEAGVIGDRFGQ